MKREAGMQKEFTGRHMLIIMLMFFGTVITVNLIMATYATTSWTGLVVKNSYVASQQFNGKAEAGKRQSARNWKHAVGFEPGRVGYRLSDAAGALIRVKAVEIVMRRPAYEAEDMKLALLERADGSYALDQSIRDGIWIVETRADFGEVEPYVTRERLVIKDGVVQ
jgi:nitrogen fixation protein FixH